MQTRRIAAVVAVLTMVAAWAWAQTSGTNTVSRNGYYFNATTGQKTDASGNVYTSEAAKDRDSYLQPLQILSDVAIASGGADTTDVVDLSGYRTVALLFQITKNGLNDWNRYAVSARYNLGGLSDSLSLFALPVSSALDTMTTTLGSVPGAAAPGYGEFTVTLPMTGTLTAAASHSLPQGKVVWLTVPQGFAWPSRCSFRIRNIGREGTVSVSPTIRVWVMGTPL